MIRQMLRHRIEQTLWPHTDRLAENPNMELVNVDLEGRPAHIPTINMSPAVAAALGISAPEVPPGVGPGLAELIATGAVAAPGVAGNIPTIGDETPRNPAPATAPSGKIDPHKVTDKDELKALLKAHGVKIVGNPSVKGLQDKLAAALAK